MKDYLRIVSFKEHFRLFVIHEMFILPILFYEVRKDAQSAGKTTGVDKILFEMVTDCLFRYFGYVKILEVSKNNSYPNGNKLLPCCCKAWRSAVYLCSSLEVLPCRSLSPP